MAGNWQMQAVPHPDWIPRSQIRAKLHKMTGTLVTEHRIGRWIARGELRMLKLPHGRGYSWYTKKEWLADLVRRYS